MSEDSLIKQIGIPDQILVRWQRMVNIIAEILQVPTVIITKREAGHLIAFRTNASPNNPIRDGYDFPLGGKDIYSGIYCEWVIRQNKRLNIPNALEDPLWHKSLGSRFGLISYMGLPLELPNGDIFGTICVMDFQSDKFTKAYGVLLDQFKDLIESHLQLLYQQILLEGQVSELRKKDTELLSYRNQLEALVVQRTKELAVTNMELVKEIEERARTAVALKESEERFRQIVENSLTGIALVRQERVVYQNPEYARLMGPVPQPDLNRYFDNIHLQDVTRVTKLYNCILAGESHSMDIDFRLYPYRKDGQPANLQWVQCRASRVRINGSDAIFLNLMDITHTKELEHLMRIKDKMASLGRVAAGIAHEIRNPLSAMNMYLKAMKNTIDARNVTAGEVSENNSQILAKIQTAANRIESIIKRVMDFSKPTAPQLCASNINHAIERAVELSKVTVRKAGVQLQTELIQNLPDCQADLNLIEQVLLNLINNATEALADKKGLKKIIISTETVAPFVVAKVSDSGTGVPPDLREIIFDPFFTTRKTGSGIGLSLVRRVILDHGGLLDLTPSKLGGAEFVVKLPISNKE